MSGQDVFIYIFIFFIFVGCSIGVVFYTTKYVLNFYMKLITDELKIIIKLVDKENNKKEMGNE